MSSLLAGGREIPAEIAGNVPALFPELEELEEFEDILQYQEFIYQSLPTNDASNRVSGSGPYQSGDLRNVCLEEGNGFSDSEDSEYNEAIALSLSETGNSSENLSLHESSGHRAESSRNEIAQGQEGTKVHRIKSRTATMDYDYRNRANGAPYSSNPPVYRPPPPPVAQSSSSSAYGQQPSLYPRVGQPSANPSSRTSSHHQSPSHAYHQTSSPSTYPGQGIRVAIKPEYRITPPPLLSTHMGDIPHRTFQFDFDFERKILAEAEKDSQNWSKTGLEHLPSNTTESTSSPGSVTDPIVRKYIATGLNREAVPIAVANYGDNPTKVQEFVKGFILLREMGFPSNNVAEALAMYDNDTDKALAHFLNSSS